MTTTINAWLSVSDLATLLNLSYSAAYRLMNRLAHVDLAPPGSSYKTMRVSKNELEKYLKQREVRA